MTTPPSGPPAGWYPDPAGGPGSRWWDGSRWTEHQAGPPPVRSTQIQAAPSQAAPVRAPVRAPVVPGWMTAGVQRLVTEEQGVATWARRAVVAYAVVAVAQMAALVARYGGTFHVWDHYLHQVNTAAQNGQSTPALPASLNPPAYLWPLDLVWIAGVVLILVWQYRAANAARWLRLPASHRPGWGVGFWFIPVANFFCPYQALRDTLPPGDPGRPRLLRLWLIYIATIAVTIACEISTIFSQPAGIVLLVVVAGLWVVVAVESLKAIDYIGASHRTISGI